MVLVWMVNCMVTITSNHYMASNVRRLYAIFRCVTKMLCEAAKYLITLGATVCVRSCSDKKVFDISM